MMLVLCYRRLAKRSVTSSRSSRRKKSYHPDYILIEDKGSGTSLIQQFRAENIYCTEIKPVGNKIERLITASSAFEQLRVFFKQEARWLSDLYDKAKETYNDPAKKMSRKERETLYHVQEMLFGKLDPKVALSLERIGETLVKNPKARKKAINYNLPNDGAVIVKQWKGKKLEVKILENGFEYNGDHYNSLSKLAKVISGYAVSGPIFFGFRKPNEKIA